MGVKARILSLNGTKVTLKSS